jgi:acyl-coenzyme A thioesterase PaaI-like protein
MAEGESHADHKARIARQFIQAIPFSRALEMELLEIGQGVAVISDAVFRRAGG